MDDGSIGLLYKLPYYCVYARPLPVCVSSRCSVATLLILSTWTVSFLDYLLSCSHWREEKGQRPRCLAFLARVCLASNSIFFFFFFKKKTRTCENNILILKRLIATGGWIVSPFPSQYRSSWTCTTVNCNLLFKWQVSCHQQGSYKSFIPLWPTIPSFIAKVHGNASYLLLLRLFTCCRCCWRHRPPNDSIVSITHLCPSPHVALTSRTIIFFATFNLRHVRSVKVAQFWEYFFPSRDLLSPLYNSQYAIPCKVHYNKSCTMRPLQQ